MQLLRSLLSLHIQGEFRDNFPGLSDFGFCRKLARTKTQQGTDKASEHNGRTVFSWALVFHTHQQKWRQFFYPLSSLCITSSPFAPTSCSPCSVRQDTDASAAIEIASPLRRLVHRLRCRQSCIQYDGSGPLPLSAVPQQETYMEPLFGAKCVRSAKGGTSS